MLKTATLIFKGRKNVFHQVTPLYVKQLMIEVKEHVQNNTALKFAKTVQVGADLLKIWAVECSGHA